MTHSWLLGYYEVGPGLFVQQYLFGGPDTSGATPSLSEGVAWTLQNETRRDQVNSLEHGVRYRPWLDELSVTSEQAITLLKAAGFEVTPAKAGLCRIDTVLVTKPETKSWEMCPDFFPEANEVFRKRDET